MRHFTFLRSALSLAACLVGCPFDLSLESAHLSSPTPSSCWSKPAHLTWVSAAIFLPRALLLPMSPILPPPPILHVALRVKLLRRSQNIPFPCWSLPVTTASQPFEARCYRTPDTNPVLSPMTLSFSAPQPYRLPRCSSDTPSRMLLTQGLHTGCFFASTQAPRWLLPHSLRLLLKRPLL